MKLCGVIVGVVFRNNDFSRKHDIILRYSKTKEVTFNVDDIRPLAYSQESQERWKDIRQERFRGDRVYDNADMNERGEAFLPQDWMGNATDNAIICQRTPRLSDTKTARSL